MMLPNKPIFLALFALSLNAPAETITGPFQGNTLTFADRQASIYYTVDNDLFNVVTTIGTGEGDVLRFVSGLHDGEQQRVDLGGYGGNKRHASLILSRSGNTITANIEERADVIQTSTLD